MQVEVVIPVKDRLDLDRCVRSLLSIQDVQRIIICDGGSVTSDCIEVLQNLQQDQRVYLLQIPQDRFNKSDLLNQGILVAQAEYLLISDADILWNEVTVQALLHSAVEQDDRLVCVAVVEESDPKTNALQRDRYTYVITTAPDITWVELVPSKPGKTEMRPGCGLLCARRSTLLKLGGYQTCFQGWGWEDQDLLIRAELMGFRVMVAGSVVHLSHSDAQRNQDFHGISPVESRDRNIQRCFQQLEAGYLQGDLTVDDGLKRPDQVVRTKVPASFIHYGS